MTLVLYDIPTRFTGICVKRNSAERAMITILDFCIKAQIAQIQILLLLTSLHCSLHFLPAPNRYTCFSYFQPSLPPSSGGLVLVQVESGGETAWRLGFITGRLIVGGAQAFSGFHFLKPNWQN